MSRERSRFLAAFALGMLPSSTPSREHLVAHGTAPAKVQIAGVISRRRREAAIAVHGSLDRSSVIESADLNGILRRAL